MDLTMKNRKSNTIPMTASFAVGLRASLLAFLAALLFASVLLTCNTGKEAGAPEYCDSLEKCFDECNHRYPPQHGSNEIEICLNSCIQDHGNPDACPSIRDLNLQ